MFLISLCHTHKTRHIPQTWHEEKRLKVQDTRVPRPGEACGRTNVAGMGKAQPWASITEARLAWMILRTLPAYSLVAVCLCVDLFVLRP